MRPALRVIAVIGAVACAGRGSPPLPAPFELSRAESVFATVLSLKDRMDIAVLRALPESAAALRPEYVRSRSTLVRALAIDSGRLADSVDRRALRVMRETLDSELTATPELAEGTPIGAAVQCDYDSRRVAGIDSLAARLYACYGRAAHSVVVDGDSLERLTVLARLSVTDDPAQRRRLFYGLQSLWHTVNGDDDDRSPWRELLRRRARTWEPGSTPFASRVRELGFDPDTVEAWLERLLDVWRATLPDSALEPWDLYYAMGATSRRLSPRIPRDSLRPLAARFYRSLGADLATLRVHDDLDPRPGKDPVSFTTFGSRPRLVDGAWDPGEPWTFASYGVGGFDNLAELLHETGHAVHIAGIRTRPAFSDWPDADLFTEAIADLADGEAYDGRWQLAYLGDSATPADNRRAAYFGVMMDACWSLFEARMQRDPSLDPNAVWATLTSRYLHAVPHPELSWWAMRGQLIDVPGYLVNYALGSFISADLRDRIVRLHGPFTLGDSTWYGFVREHIYRFGLERSARRVMEDFLGRPVTADALLHDLSGAAAGPPR